MTKIGLCITGSFCTFKSILAAIDDLVANDFDVTPIFSFNVSSLDTRFYKQTDFEELVIQKTGKQPIKTIVDAEPIGTSKGLELMLVAPCTGNTLAKIAHGITDARNYGGKGSTEKQPSRSAFGIVKRCLRRKCAKYRQSVKYQKHILRALRSGRSA